MAAIHLVVAPLVAVRPSSMAEVAVAGCPNSMGYSSGLVAASALQFSIGISGKATPRARPKRSCPRIHDRLGNSEARRFSRGREGLR